MSHDFPTSKHETRIEDVPPKRNRDFADLLHALFAVLVGAAVILFSIYLHGTSSGVESDVRSAGHVVSWLMDVPTSLLQQIAIVFITVSVLIQLLIAKIVKVDICPRYSKGSSCITILDRFGERILVHYILEGNLL